jgi:hypothetical protein
MTQQTVVTNPTFPPSVSQIGTPNTLGVRPTSGTITNISCPQPAKFTLTGTLFDNSVPPVPVPWVESFDFPQGFSVPLNIAYSGSVPMLSQVTPSSIIVTTA